MAIGTLSTLQHFALPGLSPRTTNYSAQCYILDEQPVRNVGYVTESEFEKVFLWNGSASDVAISTIDTDQAGGITFSGIETGDVILSRGSVPVIFEITKYGPLAFTATFAFLSSCGLDPVLTLVGTRPLFSADQPPPITLEAAIAEAWATPDPGDTFYDTLTFLDSASGEKLLIVYSDEDLETPQGTFTHCKFGCKHPETEGSVVGAMEITVDFLPKSAQRWIMETCKARGQVSVYWAQYLGPMMDPDAHYPIPLDITSVEQTALGATVNASFPMLTAMKFPRRLMTTSVLPGGLI